MATRLPWQSWSPDEASAWLLGLESRGVLLGLDRVRQALQRIGSPHERLKAVTIAGTNGKGSTAAFVASIAHAAGYRVGLYTSPHLHRVHERIRVGGTEILPAELGRWAARIRIIVDGDGRQDPIPLTYFEALTVMALGYFAEKEVDLAVLEVGMGGRLDATAVAAPLVAAITPVGLDHQAHLGNDILSICAEKAGIIQPECTVVSDVAPELFQRVVGPRAFDLRCPIRRAGVDYVGHWLHGGFRYRGWIHRAGPVQLGLRGLHQAQNAALACAVIESLCAHGFWFQAVHLAEGLRRARHPGRMERWSAHRDAHGVAWPAVLLDGAHNPMAAIVLAHQVDGHLPERPRVLLAGLQPDKDVRGIFEPLVDVVDSVVVTALPEGRLPSLVRIADLTHTRGIRLDIEPRLPRAVATALRHAGPHGGILVTGSLYLVGAVRPLLPQPLAGHGDP